MRNSVLLMLSLLILFSIPAYADADSLSCAGDSQGFFLPEVIQKRTISIPCTLAGTGPMNVSCVAMIMFEDEIVSTYPEIQDVGLFGKTNTVEIYTQDDSTSFVVEFSNRDLLHDTNFSYQTVCRTVSGSTLTSSGMFVSELPFSEPVVDVTRTLFQRDISVLIALLFVIIFIIILWRIIRRTMRR